jgi:hypothetical protein
VILRIASTSGFTEEEGDATLAGHSRSGKQDTQSPSSSAPQGQGGAACSSAQVDMMCSWESIVPIADGLRMSGRLARVPTRRHKNTGFWSSNPDAPMKPKVSSRTLAHRGNVLLRASCSQEISHTTRGVV